MRYVIRVFISLPGESSIRIRPFDEFIHLPHIRHGFGVTVAGADQRAAGVGYLKGAVECVSAGVRVHFEKVWQPTSLKNAREESGYEGVARANGVNHFDCEAGMRGYPLAVVGDRTSVAGGDYGEASVAAEEVTGVVFG